MVFLFPSIHNFLASIRIWHVLNWWQLYLIRHKLFSKMTVGRSWARGYLRFFYQMERGAFTLGLLLLYSLFLLILVYIITGLWCSSSTCLKLNWIYQVNIYIYLSWKQTLASLNKTWQKNDLWNRTQNVPQKCIFVTNDLT
jgi:hypothetical protein